MRRLRKVLREPATVQAIWYEINMQSTRKKLREILRNFERWREVCIGYETEQRAAGQLSAAAYHRGAKEAYDRCLDRIHQLFIDELRKTENEKL